MQPPKSGSAPKWLLGGCGCLVVLALLVGVGAFYFYNKHKGFFDDMKKIARVTESALTSAEVKDAFGTPVETTGKREQTTTKDGDRSITTITQGLSGPKGTGTLEFVMETANGKMLPNLVSGKITTPTGSTIPLQLGTEAGEASSAPEKPAALPEPEPAPQQ